VLAESPKNITDRLQRLMNAAARVVTGYRKFDRGFTLNYTGWTSLNESSINWE